MLKLSIKKNSKRRSFTTWNVRTQRGDTDSDLLFWFRQAPTRGLPVWWVDSITEPDHTHGLCTCGAGASLSAASMLHALERGIAAAARWIAVELLKDPTPPAADEKVDGVRLVLLARDSDWRLRLAHDLARDDCGGVYQDSRQWNTVETRDMIPQRSVCASKEQALAVLVSHAAPWIAAALAEELKP